MEGMIDIAIINFDEFNEVDCFLPFHILSRVATFKVRIVSLSKNLESMNKVYIHAQESLDFACQVSAVIFGSSCRTSDHIENDEIISQLQLDPNKQLIASQCSGVLFLEKLKLLNDKVVATDNKTRPIIEKQGYSVLKNPFYAKKNIASSGGCLSSIYLSAWIAAKIEGKHTVEEMLEYVALVGELEELVDKAWDNIGEFV